MSRYNFPNQHKLQQIHGYNGTTSAQRLSANFLQGETIVKLFKHMQLTAQNGTMELLILASSYLFQIDVSYFYKSSATELNILSFSSSSNSCYTQRLDRIIP
jgi:hypothetical protein